MATAQELVALKAQIMTELLPTLQKFVANQPAANVVEKTEREQKLEKRAKERAENRADQRKKYLEQLEKNNNGGRLVNGSTTNFKSAINNTPRPNPADDPIKFGSDAQGSSASLSGIQAQINALTSRLNAASIEANCSSDGNVTVTLKL